MCSHTRISVKTCTFFTELNLKFYFKTLLLLRNADVWRLGKGPTMFYNQFSILSSGITTTPIFFSLSNIYVGRYKYTNTYTVHLSLSLQSVILSLCLLWKSLSLSLSHNIFILHTYIHTQIKLSIHLSIQASSLSLTPCKN